MTTSKQAFYVKIILRAKIMFNLVTLALNLTLFLYKLYNIILYFNKPYIFRAWLKQLSKKLRGSFCQQHNIHTPWWNSLFVLLSSFHSQDHCLIFRYSHIRIHSFIFIRHANKDLNFVICQVKFAYFIACFLPCSVFLFL